MELRPVNFIQEIKQSIDDYSKSEDFSQPINQIIHKALNLGELGQSHEIEDIAGRIQHLSEKKQAYYDSKLSCFIIALFSKLGNLFAGKGFYTSAELGKQWAEGALALSIHQVPAREQEQFPKSTAVTSQPPKIEEQPIVQKDIKPTSKQEQPLASTSEISQPTVQLPTVEDEPTVPSKPQTIQPGDSPKPKRAVIFSETSEVKVGGDLFDIRADMSDRTSPRKGYSPRSAKDLDAAKKQIEAKYEAEGKSVSLSPNSHVSIEKLARQKKISARQLHYAANKKMSYIAYLELMVPPPKAQVIAKFIAGELDNIIKNLPDDQINTLNDLKQALIDNCNAQNKKPEAIDREIFSDLTKAGRSKRIPANLANAPEYPAALKAFKDGTWKENEEKIITFTELDKDLTPLMGRLIDNFFEKKHTKTVLSKFLPAIPKK
ncbi:MAG: hypothetical protein ACHQUC_10330 [Chlamydiales bacterium]